mgnify:CR=1 FL=1
MYEEFVAVDFETTGLNPAEDEIIEFGAVRVSGGEVSESFDELANPCRPLPLGIQRLTGIKPSDLKQKPSPRQVLQRLLEFIADSPVVVHNAAFEGAFLNVKTAGQFTRPLLDTLELSRIVLPTAEHRDLQSLAGFYGIVPRKTHRAAGDAETTALLWLRLIEETNRLPGPILDIINDLTGRLKWPLKDVFARIGAERLRHAMRRKVEYLEQHLIDISPLLKARRHKPEETEEPRWQVPLDLDEVTEVFRPDGMLAGALPHYEQRPEQIQMLQAVCEAFNSGKVMLVEAGTGTGKSLAYLVPAAFWATRNKHKVVISTNTKNLQSQLSEKDIPLMRKAVGFDLRTALIKGRANYLCVRKLFYVLKEPERELDEAERIALLPIITWLSSTRTGDISENSGFPLHRHPDLWRKLYCTGPECLGRNCAQLRHCFVMQARLACTQADLIVANHSVVFSELGIENPILPDYAQVIFDEAHNLESVATEQLAVRIERWSILHILNRLHRPDPRGGGRGLLANILYHLRRGRETRPTERQREAEKVLTDAMDAAMKSRESLDSFLAAAGGVYLQLGNEKDKRRFDPTAHSLPSWPSLDAEKRNLVAALASVKKRLEWLAEFLDQISPEDDFEYRADFLYETRAWLQQVEGLIRDIEFVLRADEANYVYWFEETRSARDQIDYCLAAAPLDVGPLMKDLVYDKKHSVVLSSATLSVNGDFSFVSSRLGIDLLEPERVLQLALGSSFDFDRQVLVCVPTFLPEPGQAEQVFEDALTDFLIDLHIASQGRGLTLFTSYAMLNHVYPRLKAALEHQNILLLGQGYDGNREQITRTFQKEIHSVLLGTQSFWEGVDVVGESLSCLTIAKLPFPVPTEPPIVQARCEQLEARGLDSFGGIRCRAP